MFKIYDLNFNEIPLPTDKLRYGVKALNLHLSSINRKVTTDEMPAISGYIRTLVNDGTREASINILIIASGTDDYRLKRNRLFSFFRQIGDFYIAEKHEPNKLLLVSVDESYTPERPQSIRHWAQIEIPLSIVGKPYRISRYTTIDVHNDEGLKRNGKWSRGMNLARSSNLEYVFENQTYIEVYNPSDIDLYIKQHLDFKITFECLESMNHISLLDHDSNEFVFTDELVTGDIVEIEGHRIRKNGQLSAAKFNGVYPTLRSGYSEVYQEYSMNQIKVSPGLKVTFDFRAKYD